MTATLEFNLDNADDKMAHLRCVTSLEMALVIFECLHNKADISEMCDKYNINIDKLIK